MGKVIMVIEKSKDHFGAYSDNCEGIYAGGESIEAVKADTLEAIRLLKKNLPEDRWPRQIKGNIKLEWKFDVPSFLEYYSSFMSLAGMEKMTGINQKQLSNYLNHRATPRQKQTDRIRAGIHRFAEELLSITL
jgi:predicted RNase H-like HicB family nuclease